MKFECSLCGKEKKWCKLFCEKDHLFCEECFIFIESKYVVCPICFIKHKKSTLYVKCEDCDWKDNMVLYNYHYICKHYDII